MFVSSAKGVKSTTFDTLHRSSISSRKRRGPNIELLGTPQLIWQDSEQIPLNSTYIYCCQPLRKLSNHLSAAPRTPKCSSEVSEVRIWWSTVESNHRNNHNEIVNLTWKKKWPCNSDGHLKTVYFYLLPFMATMIYLGSN